jgi:hypothetical protein
MPYKYFNYIIIYIHILYIYIHTYYIYILWPINIIHMRYIILYVYMWLYMIIYICIFIMYIYMYTCNVIYIYYMYMIYIYAYIYYICTYIYIYICIYINIRTYIFAHLQFWSAVDSPVELRQAPLCSVWISSLDSGFAQLFSAEELPIEGFVDVPRQELGWVMGTPKAEPPTTITVGVNHG